jgi:hypothetical protein
VTAAAITCATVLSPSFEQEVWIWRSALSIPDYIIFYLPGIKERVMRILLPTGKVTYTIVQEAAKALTRIGGDR